MLGNDAFMDFLKKILPDETDEEKMEEQARKLAIRKPEKYGLGYLLIDPMGNDGDGSYKKEKIDRRRQEIPNKCEPYVTFDKMRALAKKYGNFNDWYMVDTDNFLKQAKYMEDFTDNFDKVYPFEAYYTTYDRMNNNQLRTYFTWRTKARKGNILNVSTSYFYCFAYELINQIGTGSHKTIIEKLISIWTEFRKYDDSIDSYLTTWVRDYYIIYHNELPHSFSYYRDRMPVSYYSFEPEFYLEMMNYKWKSLKAVEVFSSFRITDGQFYKTGNQVVIEECACFVLKKLSLYLKEVGTDIKKLFSAKNRDAIYSFFRGAVHPATNIYDQTVILDGISTYKFNGKSRKIESPDVGKYKAIVGYILKLIEVNMRRQFGSKRSLQPPSIKQVEKSLFNNRRDYGYYAGSHISDLSLWKRKMLEAMYEDSFEERIIGSISLYLKDKNIVIKSGKLEIIKPIEIDLSKIKKIEKDHIETAKRLILEEDIEKDDWQQTETYNSQKNYRQQENKLINKTEVYSNQESGIESRNDASIRKAPLSSISQSSKNDVEPITDRSYENDELSGYTEVINTLSNEAKDLIYRLVNREKAGSNFELLVEEINEKSLEIIGDNLIEYIEGEPKIYEDYINEVKDAVGGS